MLLCKKFPENVAGFEEIEQKKKKFYFHVRFYRFLEFDYVTGRQTDVMIISDSSFYSFSLQQIQSNTNHYTLPQ